MSMAGTSPRKPANWVRSKEALISGVCGGMAKQLGLDTWLVRVAWLISILFFGTGILLYLIFSIALPSEKDPRQGYYPRVMGVCYRIGLRGDMEPGLARLLALLLFFGSFGWALVAYLVLYFVLPDENEA